MPELPEVETICRGLAASLEGQIIQRLELRRPDLRFPIPAGLADRVQGRVVRAINRRAKYILIHLDNGHVLISHLGMSGRMVIGPALDLVPARHDHVIFYTGHGLAIRYNDARRFGFLDEATEAGLSDHPLLRDIGPEPLGNGFNGPVLAARLAGKLSPIKAALLDQKIIAGLGNIYVSESLYFAGLSPQRPAGSLSPSETDGLAQAIKDVLSRAIAAGGSSLRDYVQTSGELGYFQHHWAVYGREGQQCPDCSCTQGITRIVQSNRSTFYCAERQI